ncbi:GntP family permease [Nocardia sp. NPDC052278]|uniref:GntP family permease n=1 Tax=unclassified Nocardia TaxID=2637762 RepID=UPI003681A52F
MTGHTWILLFDLAAAIGLLIFLINSRLRLHPFVALIIVSVLAALVAGEPLGKIADSIEHGAGGQLGDVGVTLAFGAMLGRLLSASGATDAIAQSIIDRAGRRMLPWAVTAAAFVIGIPMFFEVGLIVLLPLIFSVARRLEDENDGQGSPYLLVGLPAIAALATLHGMVPPHPGPLTSMAGLHANLGLTIVVGFVCAIPAIVIAGPVYARWIAPRLPGVHPDPTVLAQFTGSAHGDGPGTLAGPRMSTRFAVVPALVPVALMLLRALAEIALSEGNSVRTFLTFLGEPVMAMLAGFVVALAVTIPRSSGTTEDIRETLTDSLKSIAGILLIIGGGGAFAQVLKDSGIGKAIVTAAGGMSLSPILLGWLLALLLSLATGSATVGIVSATGIVAPLVGTHGGLQASLLVVAIGAGSIGLNWVNHAGFWLVKESFGMSLNDATKTHTVVQTLVSVVGLAMTLALSVFT